MLSTSALPSKVCTVVTAVGRVVDEDVLDVGVGLGGLLGRRGEGEADRDDGVAALAHEALEVGGEVVLAVGLDRR